MAIPVVKKGPCGSDLRSTSLFIAWFSLVILTLTLASVAMVGAEGIQYYSEQPEGTAMTAKQFAEIVTYIVVFLLATLLLFNVLLLIGIYKENKRLIFCYICIKGSVLVLVFLGAIQILVTGRFVKNNLYGLAFSGIDTYMLYLLYCYHSELNDFSNGHVYDNRGGFKA